MTSLTVGLGLAFALLPLAASASPADAPVFDETSLRQAATATNPERRESLPEPTIAMLIGAAGLLALLRRRTSGNP